MQHRLIGVASRYSISLYGSYNMLTARCCVSMDPHIHHYVTETLSPCPSPPINARLTCKCICPCACKWSNECSCAVENGLGKQYISGHTGTTSTHICHKPNSLASEHHHISMSGSSNPTGPPPPPPRRMPSTGISHMTNTGFSSRYICI